MTLNATTFVIIYGMVTLSIMGSFVYFLISRRKNHFNERMPHLRKLQSFSEKKENQIINENDPYSILGVSNHASTQEILKAFRKKMKEYHPDTVFGRGEEFLKIAAHKTIQIKKAKEQILNHNNHPHLKSSPIKGEED